MNWANALLLVVAAYAAIGAVVASVFVIVGVTRVDPAAAGTKWGFRAIIWPGAAALWPVVVERWARAGRSGDNRHGGHA